VNLVAAPRFNRVALYLAVNLAFPLVLAFGYGVGAPENPRILYLLALFPLCSSYLIDLDRLNGRYALLALFLNLYFVYYGWQDLTDLFNGVSRAGNDGPLSATEAVILVGLGVLLFWYRVVVRLGNPVDRQQESKDWSTSSALQVGLLLWVLGIAATYYWYFFVVTDKTLEGTKGIAKLSQYLTSGLVLAQMLQPMGILLLVYAWRSTKNPVLFGVVLATVFIQVLFGFVIDVKGMAISGLSLIIVTITLSEGRVPKLWLVTAGVFIYVAFPIFQTYRAVVSGNVARTEVLSNLGATLDKVFAAETRVNTGHERAQTFLERLALKASVQMIVVGTQNGIPFQHGYTLTPMLSAFLPRILWTDKPDVPTGRIVNKVFHVTDQEETYISPSHLGELYWNFGWPGVLVGMSCIGALMGFVARYNLASGRTVTRLLVTVVTVESMIHGFEGSFASSYVVWMRSVAAIGLLHLCFAKVPVTGSRREREASTSDDGVDGFALGDRFPNLLR